MDLQAMYRLTYLIRRRFSGFLGVQRKNKATKNCNTLAKSSFNFSPSLTFLNNSLLTWQVKERDLNCHILMVLKMIQEDCLQHTSNAVFL